MNDILIYAHAGGALAGIGAFLGRILTSRLGLGGTARTILVVVFTVAPLTASRHLVDHFMKGPRQAAEIDEAMRSIPVMAVIDQYYPATAADIRTGMSDLYAGRLTQAELQSRIHDAVTDLRLKALPKASQSNSLAMLALMKEQIAAVFAVSEEECSSFVLNGTMDTPLETILSADHLAREQELMTNLLKQTATNPANWADTVSEAEIIGTINSASENVMLSLTSAERDAIAADKNRIACRLTLATLDAFQALPPNRAAAAFQRYNALNIAAEQ